MHSVQDVRLIIMKKALVDKTSKKEQNILC